MAGIEVTIDREEIQRLLRGDAGLAELLERVLNQAVREGPGAHAHGDGGERRLQLAPPVGGDRLRR